MVYLSVDPRFANLHSDPLPSVQRGQFFFYSYSTFRGRGIFLEDVFVRVEFRGKRIGDALLRRVAAIARAESCFGVMLNVLAWNRSAIEFFQNYGVRFLDDWKTACLDGDALQALEENP